MEPNPVGSPWLIVLAPICLVVIIWWLIKGLIYGPHDLSESTIREN